MAGATRDLLFRQAVERATRLIDAERLIAVFDRDHVRSYDSTLRGLPAIQRLVQPRYRGSAPEVFLPLLKIAHRDPDATVVILPGDQLIDGEARLMNSVAKAAQAAAARPDLPLVIGAQPTLPDPSAPWIEPGAPVEGLEPFAVRTVARFVARPAPADLAALYEGDGLFNTRIVVAKARARSSGSASGICPTSSRRSSRSSALSAPPKKACSARRSTRTCRTPACPTRCSCGPRTSRSCPWPT